MEKHESPTKIVLLITFTLSLLLCPATSKAYDNYDFWIQTPNGWNNKQQGLDGGLKKQVMAPDGNAFIEVYAEETSNPGLQKLADAMEQGIRNKGGIYFQNRLSSHNITTDGVPAIFREYNCNYNGNKLRSCAMYAYTKGMVILALGVYVEAAAQQYHNLVYQSINSLRFSPPPTMTSNDPYSSANSPYGSDEGICDLIIGKWKWFTGSVVEFYPGGRMPGNGNHWRCADSSRRTFIVTWSNGKWIDTLTISQDGSRMDGQNQIGNRVWGTRLSGPVPTPPPPTHQTQQPVPKMNYAREIKGNMSADWRLAHGSVKPSDSQKNAEWDLSTVSGTTLRFTDPYHKGKQRYRVKITTMSGQNVDERVVGMSEDITVGPGIYKIRVFPEGGYAGWRCEWH